MPQAVIHAGPNGAGKLILAMCLVPRSIPFHTADDTARERATSDKSMSLLKPSHIKSYACIDKRRSLQVHCVP